jgi:hypothetical protein
VDRDPDGVVGGCPLRRRSDLCHLRIREHRWFPDADVDAPDHTAQDMYDNYADSPRKQRRYAKRHGGEGHDGE